MNASTHWFQKAGALPQLSKKLPPATEVVKRKALSDQDVDWCSERVRFYIRQGNEVVFAIERALADHRKLNA